MWQHWTSSADWKGWLVSDDLSRGRWQSLGRLLPKDVRERIFEPAMDDLAYERLTNVDLRIPFWMQAVATLAGCLPIAIPRLFVREGRLTRTGRIAAVSTAVLGSLVLWVRAMAQSYQSG